MRKYILITSVLSLSSVFTFAQKKIGDNPTSINANAVLDLEATNKGLLMPRIALSSTTLAAPLSAHVAGMAVYNTATAGTGNTAVQPGYYYNDGAKWMKIVAAGDNESFNLPNMALNSSTLPAGNTAGQLANNTNPASGLPSGPMFWDGTKWTSLTNFAPSSSVVLNGNTLERAAFTGGDITAAQNSNTLSIAPNAVTSDKIAANAIGAAQIADNSITNTDIAPNAGIASSKLAPGTNGQVLTTVGTVPTWQTLPQGAVQGAANGLSLVGTNVELGGNITKTTTINANANEVNLNGSNFKFDNDILINTASIGRGPGNSTTNLRFGTAALTAVTPTDATFTGVNNTAIGQNTLTKLTTANNNTAVGYKSLQLSTGFENTAVGSSSLSDLLTGTSNVSVGAGSGNNVTSGSNNVFVGSFTSHPPSSNNNVFIGRSSGIHNSGSGSSVNNIAIGEFARINNGKTNAINIGNNIVSENGNVGIGWGAGSTFFGNDTGKPFFVGTPTQRLDVDGNVRVRTLADGNNMTDFPRTVVAKADGTFGYADIPVPRAPVETLNPDMIPAGNSIVLNAISNQTTTQAIMFRTINVPVKSLITINYSLSVANIRQANTDDLNQGVQDGKSRLIGAFVEWRDESGATIPSAYATNRRMMFDAFPYTNYGGSGMQSTFWLNAYKAVVLPPGTYRLALTCMLNCPISTEGVRAAFGLASGDDFTITAVPTP